MLHLREGVFCNCSLVNTHFPESIDAAIAAVFSHTAVCRNDRYRRHAKEFLYLPLEGAESLGVWFLKFRKRCEIIKVNICASIPYYSSLSHLSAKFSQMLIWLSNSN